MSGRISPVRLGFNGNGFAVAQRDRAAPAVAVVISYSVGSVHEPAGQTGLAHLCEHLVVDGGPRSRAMGEMITDVGGWSNAATGFDYTDYFALVPSNRLEHMLAVLADCHQRIEPPTAASLATQRAVIRSEDMERYRNARYGNLVERLVHALFGPAHPLGHVPMGTNDDLENVVISDVADFLRNQYSAGPRALSIVGDVILDDAFRLADQYFGDLLSTPAPGGLPVFPPISAAKRRFEINGPFPSDVIQWATVLPGAAEPLLLSHELLLSVLADGRSSRIGKAAAACNLSITTSISVLRTRFHSVGSITLRAIRSGVDLEELSDMISGEIGRLAVVPVTPDEWIVAIARMERNWAERLAKFVPRARHFAVDDGHSPIAYPTIFRRLAELRASGPPAQSRLADECSAFVLLRRQDRSAHASR